MFTWETTTDVCAGETTLVTAGFDTQQKFYISVNNYRIAGNFRGDKNFVFFFRGSIPEHE